MFARLTLTLQGTQVGEVKSLTTDGRVEGTYLLEGALQTAYTLHSALLGEVGKYGRGEGWQCFTGWFRNYLPLRRRCCSQQPTTRNESAVEVVKEGSKTVRWNTVKDIERPYAPH